MDNSWLLVEINLSLNLCLLKLGYVGFWDVKPLQSLWCSTNDNHPPNEENLYIAFWKILLTCITTCNM
jgi:hypothetical protein